MLKRFALIMFAAAAVLTPSTNALAASTEADGVLPAEGCHAVYPYHTQAVLCGRGNGGPDK